MIHVGGEMPLFLGRKLSKLPPAAPETGFEEPLTPTIRPMNAAERLFFSDHVTLTKNHSSQNIDSVPCGRSRLFSESLSQSSLETPPPVPKQSLNLIGSPWLTRIDKFHHPLDRAEFRRKSELTFLNVLKTADRSRSLHGM